MVNRIIIRYWTWLCVLCELCGITKLVDSLNWAMTRGSSHRKVWLLRFQGSWAPIELSRFRKTNHQALFSSWPLLPFCSVLVFNDRHLTKPSLHKSLLYSSIHPHPGLSTSKIPLPQTSTRILFLTNCGPGNHLASEKSSERVIPQLRQKKRRPFRSPSSASHNSWCPLLQSLKGHQHQFHLEEVSTMIALIIAALF